MNQLGEEDPTDKPAPRSFDPLVDRRPVRQTEYSQWTTPTREPTQSILLKSSLENTPMNFLEKFYPLIHQTSPLCLSSFSNVILNAVPAAR
jgi:hypothetical protein